MLTHAPPLPLRELNQVVQPLLPPFPHPWYKLTVVLVQGSSVEDRGANTCEELSAGHVEKISNVALLSLLSFLQRPANLTPFWSWEGAHLAQHYSAHKETKARESQRLARVTQHSVHAQSRFWSPRRCVLTMRRQILWGVKARRRGLMSCLQEVCIAFSAHVSPDFLSKSATQTEAEFVA